MTTPDNGVEQIVVNVTKGSASEAAGVKALDGIRMINGESVLGVPHELLVNVIRRSTNGITLVLARPENAKSVFEGARQLKIGIPRPPGKGYGLELGDLETPDNGVEQVVVNVQPGSAGERAGIVAGDGLLAINGRVVSGNLSHDNLVDVIRQSADGINLVVARPNNANAQNRQGVVFPSNPML